jgi:heat shock protein HslJ
MTFFPAGGVGITGGCNVYTGTGWEIRGSTLVLRDAGSGTLIGCDEALSEQDRWFVAFANSRPRIDVGDNVVTLTGTGVSTVSVDGISSSFDARGIVITMVDGRWP